MYLAGSSIAMILFPFKDYFKEDFLKYCNGLDENDIIISKNLISKVKNLFNELSEYRAIEVLLNNTERSNFLLT